MTFECKARNFSTFIPAPFQKTQKSNKISFNVNITRRATDANANADTDASDQPTTTLRKLLFFQLTESGFCIILDKNFATSAGNRIK